ncbi:hypothetical protein E1295_34775 [Nonomuraea mesophila]|uniref:Uncharacterized protein n=1 Tax=Nonomuraea mesophila TaxID=2530382 RepID=A0A4V2Z7N7_9ACTN|nr:hypothetical protein [Nonomuraea mesophila]TDE37176.1 hypothetical protein E1295_34775 [Nonomuraea mesophila]
MVGSAVVVSGCGVIDLGRPRQAERPGGEPSAAPSAGPSEQSRDEEPLEPKNDPLAGDGPLFAHFKRVRAADPCDLVPHTMLKKYGPEQLTVRGSGMTECQYLTGHSDASKSVYSFKIDLHAHFEQKDAEDAEEEKLGGRTIYREEYSTDSASHRSCHYKVPYEGVEGSALALDLLKTPPRGEESRPWPQRCTAAKHYLRAVVDRIMKLPPRKGRAVGVMGKDPCARKDDLLAALGRSYELVDVRYSSPYGCELELANKQKNQKLTLRSGFAFHERQTGGVSSPEVKSRRLTMNGRYMLSTRSDHRVTKSCQNSVELRRATNSRKDDAHYVTVGLSSAKLKVEDEDASFEAPPVSCTLATKLTRIVLGGVRSSS